jgi:hypothetical protein
MIIPGSLDVATATDEEILDAYRAEGFDDAAARAHLAVLRGETGTPAD